MAVTFTETLDNDLQTIEYEGNLELFSPNSQHEETGFESKNFEDVNSSQNEFFYRSQEKKIEEKYSGIFMEDIEEETGEDLEMETGKQTEQFDKFESILIEKDDLFSLMETHFKSYSYSDILDTIEEEVSQSWKGDYQEVEEEDEISYYKESEESELQKIPLQEKTSKEPLSTEDRAALVLQIRTLRNDQKILKLKNNYLHLKCCDILLAYSRMDTVDKGIDEAMVHNDMRYKLALEEYSEAKSKIDNQLDVLKNDVQNLEEALLKVETTFNNVFRELVSLEFEKAFALRFAKSGKRLSEEEITKMLDRKKQRVLELSEVRIDYIRYLNILKNLKDRFRKMESLGRGPTSKLYGKLLTRKQTLIDRLEEQRENIRKLQKKYFTYPTVLNFLKESSSCIEDGIIDDKNKWKDFNQTENYFERQVVDLGKKRTLLRTRNQKLKDALGFLNYPILVKKSADTKDTLMKKKNELRRLKTKFSEFNLS